MRRPVAVWSRSSQIADGGDKGVENGRGELPERCREGDLRERTGQRLPRDRLTVRPPQHQRLDEEPGSECPDQGVDSAEDDDAGVDDPDDEGGKHSQQDAHEHRLVSEVCIAYAQMTPDRLIVFGIEMSNTPAARGMTSVSAARAGIAFELPIWYSVASLGKVSGTHTVKTTMRTASA